MGGAGRSMSSGPQGYGMSSHHPGGSRPAGDMGFGMDAGRGFGYPAPPPGRRFGHGPGPDMSPHGGYFDMPGMPMPHGGHGAPPPPPPQPHYHHGFAGSVAHTLFCQPPAGYRWGPNYMDRHYFDRALYILRDSLYDRPLSYNDRRFLENTMGRVPSGRFETEQMIRWLEDELRHF